MKKLFFFFLNEPEKIAHEIVAENDTNYLNEQIFERLLKVYQTSDDEITPYEMTESLFKKIPKISTWMGSLKALLVVHQLTHSLGADFIVAFSRLKLPDYADQKKKAGTNMKTLTHVMLVEAYQNYLKKLNYNYEDFKVIFNHTIDLYQHLLQQNLTLLHLLSKVQNILSLLLKFELFFEVCLLQYDNEPILRQALYFLLTDCCHFYNFVTNNVLVMIEEIFSLPSDEALFLYEIYAENIYTSKKLKKFMEFRPLLQDFELKEPTYYPIDTQLNKKVELYIKGLKLRARAGKSQNTWTSNYLTTNNGIDSKTMVTMEEANSSMRRNKTQLYLETIEGEDDQKVMHTDQGYEKNVRDLTKTILSTATPSFQIASKRPLRFLPPKPQKIEHKAERQEEGLKDMGKKLSTPTSVRHVEESTREEEANPPPYFKSKTEVTYFGQPEHDGKKTITLGKQKSMNLYIPANDMTVNRTPNESFSDSFINPRPNNFE